MTTTSNNKKGIILFGPAGAGKSSAAAAIKHIDGFGAPRLFALGAGITDIFIKLRYDGPESSGVSARQAKQEIGQGMRKLFGDEVWCRLVADEILQAEVRRNREGHPEGVFPVIDDGRQLSEHRYWREHEFITVGIVADEGYEDCRARRALRLLARDGYDQRENLDHETERSAEYIARTMCDWLIVNDGTKEKLANIIQEILRKEGLAG